MPLDVEASLTEAEVSSKLAVLRPFQFFVTMDELPKLKSFC